jgi:hypothetical protein
MPSLESPSLDALDDEWDDLGRATPPGGLKRTPSWTSDGKGGVDVSDPLGLEGFVVIVDGEDVTIFDTVRHQAESVACPSCAGDESALVQNLGRLLGDYMGKRHQSPPEFLSMDGLPAVPLDDIPQVRYYDADAFGTTVDGEQDFVPNEENDQGVTPTVASPVGLEPAQPSSTPFVQSPPEDDPTIDELLAYATSHSIPMDPPDRPLGETNVGGVELFERELSVITTVPPALEHPVPHAKPKPVARHASILGGYPIVMPIRGFKGMSIAPHILVRLTAPGGDPGDEYFGLSNRPCAEQPGNVRIFFSPSTMEEVD